MRPSNTIMGRLFPFPGSEGGDSLMHPSSMGMEV